MGMFTSSEEEERKAEYSSNSHWFGEEEAEDIFAMFNYRFATTENSDVYYSMAIASAWNDFDSMTSLTYTTQGDERVRDSHRALEGLTYLKRDFPEALIPPIDFRCRCYLVESSDALASRRNPDDAYDRINSAVNPIFATTAAKSGRILFEKNFLRLFTFR